VAWERADERTIHDGYRRLVARRYSTRVRHVFVANGCERVAEPTAEDAQLGVDLVTPAAFREHLRAGRFTDVGPGYLALDRLGLL
jgi:hypothetical protein